MAMSMCVRVQLFALTESALVPVSLRSVVDRQIHAMTDPRITALPYVFKTALGKRGAGIEEDLLEKLALANLYGWLAYDIYDDILDGEGEPRTFPAANYFLRELCEAYASIDGTVPGAKAALKGFLNEIDNANVWEQEHCRVGVMNGEIEIPDDLPRLEEGTALSERSIGHALPALVLASSVGSAFGSPESVAIEGFFRHYLVARQLNDDAHDWWDDLKRGQLNAVGAMVLRSWRGKHHADVVDLSRDERPMKFFFWQNVVQDVVAAIRDHIASARRSLASASIIEDPAPLESLLAELSSAADGALAKRTEVEKFVENRKGRGRV